MRTIKFRGKRVDNGDWIFGDLVQWQSKGKAAILPQNGDEWSNPYDFEVLTETVGQFTGLFDKNGKEIYEGDECKHKYYPNDTVRISFDESLCTAKATVISEGIECEDLFFIKSDGVKYEVIGNIHETITES